jgi:predicted CXXCH cytochrome family protein
MTSTRMRGIRRLPGKVLLTGLFLCMAVPAVRGDAATCLTGGCHNALVEKKYLHGPIAAEQIGGQGCVACHVPDGEVCSQDKGGRFKPLPAAVVMCQFCHSKDATTMHTAENSECLDCHNPHGSDVGPELLRQAASAGDLPGAGAGPPDK